MSKKNKSKVDKPSKLERKAFGLPKNGIAPNTPEPVKANEKLKLDKRTKKAWKRLKLNGAIRVRFEDDIKGLEACGNLIAKIQNKFGGDYMMGVFDGPNVRLMSTPATGEWVFIVPSLLHTM